MAGWLLWSCNETPNADRFYVIANAYCECTAELARLNQEADTIQRSRLPQHFKKIEAAYEQTRECMAIVIGQYGLLKETELDTLRALLLQRCPLQAQQRDLLQEILGQ